MQISEGKTVRGFPRFEFEDYYEQECSIQASSLATEEAIWFGVDVGLSENGSIIKHGSKFEQNSLRMHLTRDQVEQLLPILQRFVDTGRL